MNKNKKIICIVSLAVIVIISVIIGVFWTNVENHTGIIKYLDEKINNVLGLTAVTSGIATTISLVPGDAGTPIADQMMDFSFHFLIILCGVYLEKYLLILSRIFFILCINTDCWCFDYYKYNKTNGKVKKISNEMFCFFNNDSYYNSAKCTNIKNY